MKTYNVGLVGAGSRGTTHARVLEGLEGTQLVAVAEPREDVGRKLAEEHGSRWHPSLDELLAWSDVEVVLLCTPSGMHADQTIQAGQAGRHVIVEKPMATTLWDADRMIAACRDAGVRLAVIFQHRFSRDALCLKHALDAGLFGQPVLGNGLVHWYRSQEYYEASGGWRGTWELGGGGALMNQSIHTIHLLQWMLGPVESLYGYIGTLAHDIEVEDTASATLRFGSGALGTIQGATSVYESLPIRVEIRGTEGAATLEGSELSLWCPAREATVLTEQDLKIVQGQSAHQRQLREIFTALREDRQPPVAGEEARKAVEIVLGIYHSAPIGQPVTFPLSMEAPTAS